MVEESAEQGNKEAGSNKQCKDFNLEDEGPKFLRNVNTLPPYYQAKWQRVPEGEVKS
jgi:hypothetical protein